MPDNSFQLSVIDITTGSNPEYTILWMHGLGADGNDFVPVVQALDLPEIPIRFLFPHAPQQPVTINGGYIMRAWYDIQHTDFSAQEDETGIRRSQHAIIELIEREDRRGIPPDAGIIALSGYLPLAHKIEREAHITNRITPIFMAHGNDDPIVPIELAHTSLQQLREYHYPVTWHEYPMEHTVCDQELVDISCWLRIILK